MNNKKLIIRAVIAFVGILIFLWINPFEFNDPTNRTVVTQANGKQFVRFDAGIYYAGFFSKTEEYPNQISVSHQDTVPSYNLQDNTIEIGRVTIRFNDATTAQASGITQYILPSTEKEMLEIHNAHKSVGALVRRRLAPYTQECLQSSAQLMSSEMHYSGGRAQMTQDYIDQLRNGSFLLSIKSDDRYDSTEKAMKRIYKVDKQTDKNNQPLRKFSSIKEYAIMVGDAQITTVKYEEIVNVMLEKKIKSATNASVSKQDLITAQQQAQTAKAQGEKKLVDIEYTEKQKQTQQVVAAQTKVQLAEQNRQEQEILLKASALEAQKIKTLADANAYDKQRAIQANGALEQKLEAYVTTQKFWADAFAKYAGNIVPQYQSGASSGQNGAFNFMELMSAKAARDLSLDLSNKK